MYHYLIVIYLSACSNVCISEVIRNKLFCDKWVSLAWAQVKAFPILYHTQRSEGPSCEMGYGQGRYQDQGDGGVILNYFFLWGAIAKKWI